MGAPVIVNVKPEVVRYAMRAILFVKRLFF
jgi:hypothetical protein